MFRLSCKGGLCSVTLLQQSPNPQTNERETEILQLQILGFMSVRMRGEEIEMWTNEWENDLGILQILDSFRKG